MLLSVILRMPCGNRTQSEKEGRARVGVSVRLAARQVPLGAGGVRVQGPAGPQVGPRAARAHAFPLTRPRAADAHQSRSRPVLHGACRSAACLLAAPCTQPGCGRLLGSACALRGLWRRRAPGAGAQRGGQGAAAAVAAARRAPVSAGATLTLPCPPLTRSGAAGVSGQSRGINRCGGSWVPAHANLHVLSAAPLGGLPSCAAA